VCVSLNSGTRSLGIPKFSAEMVLHRHRTAADFQRRAVERIAGGCSQMFLNRMIVEQTAKSQVLHTREVSLGEDSNLNRNSGSCPCQHRREVTKRSDIRLDD
jgi:hypothetical protein